MKFTRNRNFPAEAMFRSRIWTVFNAMLSSKLVKGHGHNPNIRSFNVVDEVFIKSYLGKNRWEPTKFVRKRGKVFCGVRGTFGTCIRHTNQIHNDKRTMRTQNNQPNLSLELISDTST
uniref:Uncharacterized protein n=1 Tax=Schistosoma haematobium TaxID=6185 RepID=A0A095AK68_SCHHA